MKLTGTSIFKHLKNIDAYPKTLDDYRIRTFTGGTVSLISYITMAFLILLEFNYYITPTETEKIHVDTARVNGLPIFINITVPHIPCKHLSLDAMDSSGDQQVNIDHDVYKTPIDMYGRAIAPAKKDSLVPARIKDAFTATLSNSTGVATCGSCYGAESSDLNITCCNTCSDVKAAYLKRRWALPEIHTIEQCKDEPEDGAVLENEGCYIHGKIDVTRVEGSFHIAPGQSYSVNHLHVHDVSPFKATDFNTTHRIDHLCFGYNVPGKTNPIDGEFAAAVEEATMFQYFIKVVPTSFLYFTTLTVISTNQISVTRHESSGLRTGNPPGIFFYYEFSPLSVEYSLKTKSLGHFLTNACAIIGGVFTVASIIDSLLYRSLKALQHKIEIGKVG